MSGRCGGWVEFFLERKGRVVFRGSDLSRFEFSELWFKICVGRLCRGMECV